MITCSNLFSVTEIVIKSIHQRIQRFETDIFHCMRSFSRAVSFFDLQSKIGQIVNIGVVTGSTECAGPLFWMGSVQGHA